MAGDSEPIKTFLDRIGPDVEAGRLLSESDQKRIYGLAVLGSELDLSIEDELRAKIAELEDRVEKTTPERVDYLIEALKPYEIINQQNNRISELEEALAFYADAETYHAIAFLADPPCGEFMEDFSEDHGDEYDRPMPGKLARSKLAGNNDRT